MLQSPPTKTTISLINSPQGDAAGHSKPPGTLHSAFLQFRLPSSPGLRGTLLSFTFSLLCQSLCPPCYRHPSLYGNILYRTCILSFLLSVCPLQSLHPFVNTVGSLHALYVTTCLHSSCMMPMPPCLSAKVYSFCVIKNAVQYRLTLAVLSLSRAPN